MTSVEKEKKASPEQTKEAKEKLEKNLMKKAAGAVWGTTKDFVNVVGPANMTRAISAGLVDKKEWIEESYRHHRIIRDVQEGDRDENGELLEKELLATELQGLCEHFKHKGTLITKLGEKLEELSELEMVQETGHGRGILITKQYLHQLRGDVGAWWKRSDNLHKQVQAAAEPDAELRLACARHRVEVFEVVTQVNAKLTEAQTKCADALDFEAIKAIVTDPENKKYQTYQENTKAGLKVINQGLGAVDTAGKYVGSVPDPHAKAAAMGAHIAVSVLKVLKVGFDKIAISMAVNEDIKDYKKKEPLGAEFAAHRDNPFLIAEMLGRKRVRDVEFVLSVVAEPIVRELGDLCPIPMVVDTAWKAIHDMIIGVAEKYQKKRVEDAREALEGKAAGATDWKNLTPKSAAEAAEKFGLKMGEDFLEEIKGTLENNVFELLNPLQLAANAVIHSLAQRIARLVVEALPSNPAEDINGDKLYEHMQGILGVLRHVVQVQPRPDMQVGLVCPSWTDDGRAVRIVLSPERKGKREGMPCWLVQLQDRTIGTVYALDGIFDPDDNLGLTAEELPPRKDDFGVLITEVNVPSKTVTALRDGITEIRYSARVGPVLGHLLRREQGGEGSWGFEVDESRMLMQTAFVDWSQRFIHYPAGERGTGYEDRLTGTFVAGTWYKPFANRFNYLFISDTGEPEWALGVDNAGNMPNTPVLKVLEKLAYDDQHSLAMLLPRLG